MGAHANAGVFVFPVFCQQVQEQQLVCWGTETQPGSCHHRIRHLKQTNEIHCVTTTLRLQLCIFCAGWFPDLFSVWLRAAWGDGGGLWRRQRESVRTGLLPCLLIWMGPSEVEAFLWGHLTCSTNMGVVDPLNQWTSLVYHSLVRDWVVNHVLLFKFTSVLNSLFISYICFSFKELGWQTCPTA